MSGIVVVEETPSQQYIRQSTDPKKNGMYSRGTPKTHKYIDFPYDTEDLMIRSIRLHLARGFRVTRAPGAHRGGDSAWYMRLELGY